MCLFIVSSCRFFQIKIYFHDFTLNLFNLFGYLRKTVILEIDKSDYNCRI